MSKYTFNEICLGLEVYEQFLLQEAYDSGNKQLLAEVNLSFKGVKDLPKKALAKFKSLNTAEKTFVGLLGKIKKETNKSTKEIVNFIRLKAKEYKGKSLKDIQKDIEKIYNEFTGKKLDEALSDKARSIGGFILLAIYLVSSVFPAGFSAGQNYDDIVNLGSDNIEVTQDVDIDGSGDDPDTLNMNDAEAIAATAAASTDIAFDTVKSGINDQGVKIDLGDIGGAISFDNGEFDANQSDIDEIAQDVVDDLEASLDGKDLKKANIDPFGLISNTPGDQDNNPNGPGDDGLDSKRLDVAKKIAKKVQDLLKDKYPDADVSVGEGTTNSDSVDGQKEVDRGSTESSSTQVAGVSLNDIETSEASDDLNIFTLLSKDKARIKDAKLELNDTSRFRAILFMFLPLIIDDFEDTLKKIGASLKLEKEDFPLKRNTVFKKLKTLREKPNKTEDDELVIKVVEWAVGSSRQPRKLKAQINALDPKVNMGEKAFMIATAAGSRGKDMGLPGSGFTQGNTGMQTTSPSGTRGNRGSFRNSTVAENFLYILETLYPLNEAQTDFSNLPNFNSSKAKENLGILVPLYSSYWAGKGGIPISFDIDYVMKQYKSSWDKFENDYPVIAGEINWDNYIEIGDDGKPSTPTQGDKGDKDKPTPEKDKDPTPKDPSDQSFDKDSELEPETSKIKDLIDDIGLLKSRLKLINNKAELQKLILAVVLFTNKNFIAAQQRVVRSLFKARNRFKPIKETEATDDLANLTDKDYQSNIKVIDALRIAKYLDKYPNLKNLLQRVNTEEELIELILVVILPYVNPTLHKNPTVIKSAIIGAANQYRDLKQGEELTMFLDKTTNERKLTKPEAKAKERIVKDLKGAKADFKKRYGDDAEAVMYATATKRAKKVAENSCDCGCGDSEIDHTINELIGDLVYEELCKRGKAYIAARKRAGEKSSAYLSGRAVKVCKGQIKGAGGKRKKSYRKKKRKTNEVLYNQLKPQVLNHLEELFNDPHFAIIAEYENIEEAGKPIPITINGKTYPSMSGMIVHRALLRHYKTPEAIAQAKMDAIRAYDKAKADKLAQLDPADREMLFGDPTFADLSLEESLKDWFGKEDWVRIDTQGNIAGKCGTMPKGKATQRCLPRAKANSLTKKQRAATSRKKVRGSKQGKQFVKNTKKAKVSFKKK